MLHSQTPHQKLEETVTTTKTVIIEKKNFIKVKLIQKRLSDYIITCL